jgi:hypothetical protein
MHENFISPTIDLEILQTIVYDECPLALEIVPLSRT